jgi:hypothetical protein
MPSAEEILRARDEGAPAPEEKEEKPAVDFKDQEPRFDKGDAVAPAEKSEESAPEGDGRVPQQALHEAREKSRRYTEEVVDLRRQIAELSQAVLRQQQQPPPQAPQAEPEFDWDNPRNDIRRELGQALQQERRAIAAELQAQREAFQSARAMDKHGEETVREAYAALEQAKASDPAWGAAYAQIMKAPDQYEELVRWHKSRKALQEVGTDLEAYKAKVRAEYLEELRNGRATPEPLREERREVVRMPSDLSNARSVGSRSGPAWNGPPSIKDILSRQ